MVVLLLILAVDADVVCDPNHTPEGLQDFVHSGLDDVLRHP